MVFDRIKGLMASQLNIPQEKITMEANIINDLGADSLDVVEMLMTLEEEYNIEVPDEVVVELKTVGSIVEYIEANRK